MGRAIEPQRDSASQQITERIAELDDWRGKTLARIRELIRAADPDVVEEWKWDNPVWSHGGILCTGESYKSAVKMTFAKGASLPDPKHLFNSSLEGKTRRAIDFHEGGKIDATALQALIRAAVAHNVSGGPVEPDKPTKQSKPTKPAASRGRARSPKARKPAMLPKSDGDAGVKAYIESMEPWQAALTRRVDALVGKLVPKVRRGMRWHCPFYGVEGEGWFLAFAGFQRHVKFSFCRGAELAPPPPLGAFKDVRSLDVREDDAFDEAQFARWIEQAAALPGWDGGSKRLGGAPL